MADPDVYDYTEDTTMTGTQDDEDQQAWSYFWETFVAQPQFKLPETIDSTGIALSLPAVGDPASAAFTIPSGLAMPGLSDMLTGSSENEAGYIIGEIPIYSQIDMIERNSGTEEACMNWYNAEFDQTFDFCLGFDLDADMNFQLNSIELCPLPGFQEPGSLEGRSGDHNDFSGQTDLTSEDGLRQQVTGALTGQYTCSICGNVYGKSTSLKRHHRDKHQNIKHVCDQCSKEFTRLDSLLRHKVEQHEDTTIDAATDSQSKKTQCRICGYKVRPSGLAAHQQSKSCRSSIGGLAIESTTSPTQLNALEGPTWQGASAPLDAKKCLNTATLQDWEYGCYSPRDLDRADSNSDLITFPSKDESLYSRHFRASAATGKRQLSPQGLKEIMMRKKLRLEEVQAKSPVPYSLYQPSTRCRSPVQRSFRDCSTAGHMEFEEYQSDTLSAIGFQVSIQQQSQERATVGTQINAPTLEEQEMLHIQSLDTRAKERRQTVDESERGVEQSLKREEYASTAGVRQVRVLIRAKYRLDVWVWSHRNVQKHDRKWIMHNCLKADEMLQEILFIVNAWDETLFDPEDWRIAKKIKEGLSIQQPAMWADTPPWERRYEQNTQENESGQKHSSLWQGIANIARVVSGVGTA